MESGKIWEEKIVAPAIRKNPERQQRFENSSGIEVERLYTPGHIHGLEYERDLGFPGVYPFTRGIQPTMYRGRLWTMRQYAGFGSARETNERYRYLLESGQTGLSVAFDLPTQMGYDSDHPLVAGEVGKVGVAIDSIEDMEILFKDIQLDKISTSMTINSTAAVLLAMYIAVSENHGIAPSSLSGTIQNDILKEYVARGTYIFPPEPSMRIITDIFKYCSSNLPKWNPISISGYHIREAGSTAVQELAFTLANAITYVEYAIRAGLNVDDFASRLSFFFNAHNNLFEEVAKFRAGRRLWAKIMKHEFGAKDPRSWTLRFHTQTAGCTLQAQQPENNVIRVALQALAAVLGGTQSLHTNSLDEALSLPTEKSVEIALRTQQIIAYESGVSDTVDPLGGSYYIECMTDRIEHEVSDYLEKIKAMGGSIRAIEQGFFQNEIEESAYKFQKQIESGDRKIVGMNCFTKEEKSDFRLLEVDEKVGQEQVKRLRELKDKRNNIKVQELLSRLQKAAVQGDNLMPLILNAVRERVTLGEICDTLRKQFGVYRR